VSVALDGQMLSPTAYSVTQEHLIIREVPDKFVLETVCRIVPELNTALSGFYQSGTMLTTQCEAEGFRRITYFLDRP